MALAQYVLSMDRISAPTKMTIKLVMVKYLTSQKGLVFSFEGSKFMAKLFQQHDA
jgi:hypothetical protein